MSRRLFEWRPYCWTSSCVYYLWLLGATERMQFVYQHPLRLRPLPNPESTTIRRHNSECSDKTTDLLPHISRSDTRERTSKNHSLSESAGFSLYIAQVLATPDVHISTSGLYITAVLIKVGSNTYLALWFPTWLLRSSAEHRLSAGSLCRVSTDVMTPRYQTDY